MTVKKRLIFKRRTYATCPIVSKSKNEVRIKGKATTIVAGYWEIEFAVELVGATILSITFPVALRVAIIIGRIKLLQDKICAICAAVDFSWYD